MISYSQTRVSHSVGFVREFVESEAKSCGNNISCIPEYCVYRGEPRCSREMRVFIGIRGEERVIFPSETTDINPWSRNSKLPLFIDGFLNMWIWEQRNAQKAETPRFSVLNQAQFRDSSVLYAVQYNTVGSLLGIRSCKIQTGKMINNNTQTKHSGMVNTNTCFFLLYPLSYQFIRTIFTLQLHEQFSKTALKLANQVLKPCDAAYSLPYP